MHLYLLGTKYLGTQAEARAEAKALGIRFDPDKHGEEVPTDKAGLIAYLNANVRPQLGAAAPVAPAPPSDSPFSAKNVIAQMDAHVPLIRSERLTVLEEAIQTSDGFELSSLLGNVIARLEELRREAKLPAREPLPA